MLKPSLVYSQRRTKCRLRSKQTHWLHRMVNQHPNNKSCNWPSQLAVDNNKEYCAPYVSLPKPLPCWVDVYHVPLSSTAVQMKTEHACCTNMRLNVVDYTCGEHIMYSTVISVGELRGNDIALFYWPHWRETVSFALCLCNLVLS